MEVECSILQLLTAPECALDALASGVRLAFPDAESLASEECRTMLRVALGAVSGNTYDTECIHSQNLRKQRSRNMTDRVIVEDLAVQHASRSCPHLISALFRKEAKGKRKRGVARQRMWWQRRQMQQLHNRGGVVVVELTEPSCTWNHWLTPRKAATRSFRLATGPASIEDCLPLPKDNLLQLDAVLASFTNEDKLLSHQHSGKHAKICKLLPLQLLVMLFRHQALEDSGTL